MKRALKLVLPALVAAEIVLVWSGVMNLRDAVFVVAGLEILLLVVGAGNLLIIVRRYRRGRKEGLDAWAALEDGLALVLPRAVARLAVNEPRLLVSLFRWTFRRVELGEGEFGYHKRAVLRAIVPMLIVTSPVELLVVHLLAEAFSPWGWVKWALLILGIYAILWLLGLYASLVALPHRLEATGLRVRYGAFMQGFVPYEEIEDTVREDRKAPSFGDGLEHVPDEDALYLSTGGKTDVTLRLRAPLSVDGFLKKSAPARLIHLAADDPERLARELRRRVETSTSAASVVDPPVASENLVEG